MHISLKRAYEPRTEDDGFRILVDRMWPRGVSKDQAHVALWLKEIAPSTALRKWFNHEVDKWPEFQKRYTQELDNAQDAVRVFLDAVRGKDKVTLIYGAKDEKHNQAVVLRDYLAARYGD